jgi:hypothetical protein
MRGGWYPVGLVTAPSSQLVNKAIFTNEDALLQARHKASPERPSANQGNTRDPLSECAEIDSTLHPSFSAVISPASIRGWIACRICPN